MQSMYVHKIVAQENNHEVYNSSIEEFQYFLNGRRPDFDDKNVLAVKFVFSIYPDNLDDAEETRWFINTFAVKAPDEFPSDDYGPKMPAEFPPFLLRLVPRFAYPWTVFDKYQNFIRSPEYDIASLPVAELANKFLKWCEENPSPY